jgi:hypothetical protein
MFPHSKIGRIVFFFVALVILCAIANTTHDNNQAASHSTSGK